jgi:hypothetical protein
MNKRCPTCDIIYKEPLIKWFDRNKRQKDGFSTQCKVCRKKHRKESKSVIKQYNKKYYRNNNGIVRSQMSRWERYKLTPEKYNVLFNKQKGRCAICGKHQSELKRGLFVDHNHDTNVVRGLLCHNCNVGMGNLQDDIKLLSKAMQYLKNQGVV